MRQSKHVLEVPPVPEKPISVEALDEVKQQFRAYCFVVFSADLSPGAKDQYINGAECFVRWLQGRFRPGQRGRKAA